MPQDTKREFRYFVTLDGSIKVAVNPVHYGKSLSFINGLAEELRAAIPFDHTVVTEPEVHVLGGHSRKRMVSVEMRIAASPDVKGSPAELLQQKGFQLHLEEILG